MDLKKINLPWGASVCHRVPPWTQARTAAAAETALPEAAESAAAAAVAPQWRVSWAIPCPGSWVGRGSTRPGDGGSGLPLSCSNIVWPPIDRCRADTGIENKFVSQVVGEEQGISTWLLSWLLNVRVTLPFELGTKFATKGGACDAWWLGDELKPFRRHTSIIWTLALTLLQCA